MAVITDSSSGKDKVYVMGGNTGTTAVADTHIFDTNTNLWTTPSSLIPDFPYTIQKHKMVTVGTRLWVFGNYPSAATSTRYFDTTTNTWTFVTATGTAPGNDRSWMHVAQVNGTVYYFGGVDESFLFYNDLYSFDATNYLWKQLSPGGSIPPKTYGGSFMPTGNPSLSYSEGRIVLMGGLLSGVYYNHVYLLDVSGWAQPKWFLLTTSGHVPNARFLHNAGVNFSTKQYVVIGGFPLDRPWVLHSLQLQPLITNITETTGPISGGRTVIIRGLGIVPNTGAVVNVMIGEKNCTVLTVEKSGTSAVSNITCVTPVFTSTSTRLVTVYDTDYTPAFSATTYTPVLAPVITSISPAFGSVSGGTTVNITASARLAQSAADLLKIRFNNTCSSLCTIQSYNADFTNIVCQTAAASTCPGAFAIIVTSIAGGDSATFGAPTFTFYPVPSVTTIVPNAGPQTGGTAITITGTLGWDVPDLNAVTINGVTCTNATTLSVFPITQIACTTGNSSTSGSFSVVVNTTKGGVGTSTPTYTFHPKPVVTSVLPAILPPTGGVLTITGANFNTTLAASNFITIGSSLSCTSPVVASASSMTCTAPANSVNGSYIVTVRTLLGGYTTAFSPIVYRAAPAQFTLTPSAGPLNTQTPVTITGTGFGATGEPVVVMIGERACLTPVTLGAPWISGVACTVPASSVAGTAAVTVATLYAGNVTSLVWDYRPVPIVTSINTIGGPLAGGTFVIITGTNLSSSAADLASVMIGTATCTLPAASGTPVNSIGCTTSAQLTSGTYVVKVTSTTGGPSVNTDVVFTYAGLPNVTKVTPSSGNGAGGTLLLMNGTFLGLSKTDITSVTIGGSTCTVVTTFNSPVTALTCTTGANTGGGSYPIVVTSQQGGAGTSASSITYTYTAAPAVTGVTPSSGLLSNQNLLTITGTNLGLSAADVSNIVVGSSKCYLNSTTGTPITSITCTVMSAATSGTFYVVVTTTSGGIGSSSAQFTFIAPTVSSIFPQQGPISGGTVVTIGGTTLAVDKNDLVWIKIGGYPCTLIQTTDTPVSSLTCTTGVATVEGTYNVQVNSTTYGIGTLTGAFTYQPVVNIDPYVVASPPATATDNTVLLWALIGAALGVLLFTAIICGICCYYRRKRKQQLKKEGAHEIYFDPDEMFIADEGDGKAVLMAAPSASVSKKEPKKASKKEKEKTVDVSEGTNPHKVRVKVSTKRKVRTKRRRDNYDETDGEGEGDANSLSSKKVKFSRKHSFLGSSETPERDETPMDFEDTSELSSEETPGHDEDVTVDLFDSRNNN